MKSTKKTGQALRAIDAPLYRYWQAFYCTFFSGSFYVDVGKRWKGFGFMYALLMFSVLSLPFACRIAYDFSSFYQNEIISPLEHLPKIYIQNGLIQFNQTQPYFIQSVSGKKVLAIDTTGTLKTIDAEHPELTMLMTKKQFFYRLPVPQYFFESSVRNQDPTIYVQDFGSNVNEVFDGRAWVKSSGIYKVKLVGEVLFYPMVVSVFFSVFFIFYLLLTPIAQIVASLFIKYSLSYQQACRVFITSSTPAMVLAFLSLTTNYVPPFYGLIILIVLFYYFGFAVYNLKREGKRLVHHS